MGETPAAGERRQKTSSAITQIQMEHDEFSFDFVETRNAVIGQRCSSHL